MGSTQPPLPAPERSSRGPYNYLLLLLRVYLKNDDFEVNYVWVLFDEWEFEWLCLTAGKHGILIMEFYPNFMYYAQVVLF